MTYTPTADQLRKTIALHEKRRKKRLVQAERARRKGDAFNERLHKEMALHHEKVGTQMAEFLAYIAA